MTDTQLLDKLDKLFDTLLGKSGIEHPDSFGNQFHMSPDKRYLSRKQFDTLQLDKHPDT